MQSSLKICGTEWARDDYVSRSPVRATLHALAALGVLAALLLLHGPDFSGQAHAAGETHHAGVVIQFDGGGVQTFCVKFTGDTISGLDLLLKTGLSVKLEAYGMGAMVCKIGPDGCDFPGQPCACLSYGQDGVYWSYHHLKDGKWRSSSVGAGSYKLHDGDVDGWAWTGGTAPLVVPAYALLCAASAFPTHTVTVTPLATPSPSRTAARQPTLTSAPTRTRTATRTASPPLSLHSTASKTTVVPTSPVVIPSRASTAEVATALPLPAFSPSATVTLTETPSPPSRTATPGATTLPTETAAIVSATAVAVAVATPASPQRDGGEAAARTVAALVGAASALGVLLWRGLLILVRKRGRNRI